MVRVSLSSDLLVKRFYFASRSNDSMVGVGVEPGLTPSSSDLINEALDSSIY